MFAVNAKRWKDAEKSNHFVITLLKGIYTQNYPPTLTLFGEVPVTSAVIQRQEQLSNPGHAKSGMWYQNVLNLCKCLCLSRVHVIMFNLCTSS